MEGVKELIELQRLDTELQSKKRRLAEIEALMNDSQELRQARTVLERTHTQFRKLETDQKSVEWDVDQTRDRIVQVERRLMGNQVTNPRELETLQREIDNLKKRQNDLEETTLDAMEKVERARPIVDARESAAAKLEGEWSAAQAAMGTERQEISAALPSLEAGACRGRGGRPPGAAADLPTDRRQEGRHRARQAARIVVLRVPRGAPPSPRAAGARGARLGRLQ